jgi:uncharacterized protein YdhG (YjbR/CyaY superfamily)
LRANYDHQPGRIRFRINARAPMMLFTSLMTRLILDHAATTAALRAKEADHDL